MKKKSHLTDEDRALWKHATSVVEPHKRTEKHQKKRTFKSDEARSGCAPPKHASVPVQKTKWKSLTHEPITTSAVKKALPKTPVELPAIASDVFAGIKTKKRKVDARLDLHGLTQDAAHRKAIAFISQCYARHLKIVLIITGKGNASNSEGVLQKNLNRWLGAHSDSAKHISGITQAPRELGGAGAFVVTLKKH